MNMSFDMRIPNDKMIRFDQNESCENFIGQFQPFCSKLLCIINGTYLHYYDNASSLPANIRFDYKQQRSNLTEYYFRQCDDNTQYCVFGREAATIFYSNIDNVDPKDINEPLHKSIQFNKSSTRRLPIVQVLDTPKMQLFHKNNSNNPPINPKNTIIIDDGVELAFIDINYPIKIITHHSS